MANRFQTKQRLADLSGKPVNGISMQRLAPMFARQVVARRQAEDRYSAEDQVHPTFIDHLKAKAAKLLEAEAENTVANLPVSSVYDALQITQQHKSAGTDAGIRAWRGMLKSMWKANRTANITAESFLKYRDYFDSNFPKSAVSEVFDTIGAQGYAALPVSDLLVMASRIYSQADFDYEMTAAGLTTRQPMHVKARNFVLAVLNGEVNPETGFSPEEEMSVADWLVQKNRHEMQGGDPDEFRRDNPPPKRRQQAADYDAGITLESGPHGTYLIVNNDTGEDVLIQNDLDFPSVASDFGWSGVESDEDAQEYLDEHIGDTIDDPGYFHKGASKRPFKSKSRTAESFDESFGIEEMGGYDEDDSVHPGKFEGVPQEDQLLVQELYGETADEETDSPEGWYGLYLGYGKGPAVILFEGSQGFVDIDKFETDEEAQAKFEAIQEELGGEGWYGDDFEMEARKRPFERSAQETSADGGGQAHKELIKVVAQMADQVENARLGDASYLSQFEGTWNTAMDLLVQVFDGSVYSDLLYTLSSARALVEDENFEEALTEVEDALTTIKQAYSENIMGGDYPYDRGASKRNADWLKPY